MECPQVSCLPSDKTMLQGVFFDGMTELWMVVQGGMNCGEQDSVEKCLAHQMAGLWFVHRDMSFLAFDKNTMS